MATYRVKRFSWFDKLKDLADRANKRIDPSYKTEKERIQERFQELRQERERKQKELDEKISGISRQHKIILDIYHKVYKFIPSWGDGDEYPCFFINDNEEGGYFGNVCLGCQGQPEYHWDGKSWIDISDRNRKVYNLKRDILEFLESERKQWEKVDYLDDSDIKEVLVYLDKLSNEISKSNL